MALLAWGMLFVGIPNLLAVGPKSSPEEVRLVLFGAVHPHPAVFISQGALNASGSPPLVDKEEMQRIRSVIARQSRASSGPEDCILAPPGMEVDFEAFRFAEEKVKSPCFWLGQGRIAIFGKVETVIPGWSILGEYAASAIHVRVLEAFSPGRDAKAEWPDVYIVYGDGLLVTQGSFLCTKSPRGTMVPGERVLLIADEPESDCPAEVALELRRFFMVEGQRAVSSVSGRKNDDFDFDISLLSECAPRRK